MDALDHTSTPAQLVDRGDRLAETASLVGDESDFHEWRTKRNQWVDESAALLEARAALDTAADFVRAVTIRAPAADWQLALPRELQTVHDALAVLEDMQACRPDEPAQTDPQP